MSDKDILKYADDSPFIKEMQKPQIKYLKNQNYGVRKIHTRIKSNCKKVFRNG